MTKKEFYVTFGQRSPFKDGWVTILASGPEEAKAEADEVFGNHYSRIYRPEFFEESYFPAGQIGRTIEAL